jgi:lysophospholipase
LETAASLVHPRDVAADESISITKLLANRAFPDSPTGGYAPGKVNCPSNRPTIRPASALSDNETSWLQIRRAKTLGPMQQFLSRMNIPGFDVGDYMAKHKNNMTELPNIGIAISGGGYRAMLTGAGTVAAFDNRTSNSMTNASHLGGLLQSATYLTGLSGGGWLVGSLMMNNFSSVTTLRDGSPGSSVWKFSNSILEGPDVPGLSTADYYRELQDAVSQKADSPFGFETSITDYW